MKAGKGSREEMLRGSYNHYVQVSVEPHRLPGVFITRNRKEGDRLLTRKHGSGIKEDADKVVVIKVCNQRGRGLGDGGREGGIRD